MRLILPILLACTLFLGCQFEKDFETKTVSASRFSLDIPVFLKKSDNLHDEAALQYQNLIREYYTIVIEEPIEDFQAIIDIEDYYKENFTPDLDGYTKLVRENMLDVIESKEESKVTETKINGMPCRMFEISGKIDGMDIYYAIAYIQGKKNFYQVVNWTLLGNKKKYAATMEKSIMSFKEKR